jgi:hypothetical protein
MSFTKYLRNGIRNKIPNMPPNNDAKKICKNVASRPNIYNPGIVNIAPATITPDADPIDWIITFSESAFLRFVKKEIPTAIIAIGIAASKTCPIFNPKYAAAAENKTAKKSPHATDQTVTSGRGESAGTTGKYSSPSFNGRYAFSGNPFD